MIITKSKTILLAIGFTFTSMAFAADAAKLAESCMGCHGKDGASTDTNIPSIGGLSAKYFNVTFKAYKEKTRTCAETEIKTGDQKGTKSDMCKAVEGLSDEDVKGLVKFFSAKKFVRADQKFDAALAAKGKELHKVNCEKCHSEGGSMASDDASILAGQQMGYLTATFKDLTSDKRFMEKKMKAKIDGLDKDAYDALVNYYGSFK
jgi:sulfide dehydrogenase cytochrome subunit